MAKYNFLGMEVSPEANAKRLETLTAYGKDALRQMNPVRDTSVTPTQPKLQEAIIPTNKEIINIPLYAIGNSLNTPEKVVPTQKSNYESSMRKHLVNNKLENIEPTQTLKTLTQGTPGQDGYGKVTYNKELPKPGSFYFNNGDSNNPNAVMTNVKSLASLGNTKGTTRAYGMEFNGTASDAAKFFAEPPISQKRLEGLKMIYDRNNPEIIIKEPDSNFLQTIPHLPSYGAHGGGWKTRLETYKADLNAYNQANGQNIQSKLSQLDEKGANQRALAQTEHWNNQDKIAMDAANTANKLQQIEIDNLNRVQAAQDAYSKNPSKENESILRGLLGKFENNKNDVKVIDQFDPITGNKTGQKIYKDDGSGNYVDVTPKATEHPAIAFLRNNDTPQNRELFKRMYGKLPEGFK